MLMIEINKAKKKLNPSFMEVILIEKTNTYTLRNDDGFMVPRANTTAHGIETIRYMGSRFLQPLPKEIKEFRNLQVLG